MRSLKQKPWRKAALLSRSLAPLPAHAQLALIQGRLTCLGMLLPTVGRTLPHQLIIKMVSYRHAHRSVYSRQFLHPDISQMMLGCQVGNYSQSGQWLKLNTLLKKKKVDFAHTLGGAKSKIEQPHCSSEVKALLQHSGRCHGGSGHGRSRCEWNRSLGQI